MEILKPYRVRIDNLDDQIIQLLRRRYDVIEEVAAIKHRENLPAHIPERIDEVRERAAALAAKLQLDEDFVRKLYAQLIEHSCQLEDELMATAQKMKAAK